MRTKERACLKDTSEGAEGVKAEWCSPGQSFYNRTKGYRKVPGDKCVDGEDEEGEQTLSKYAPELIPCPVK
jgi:hypothetical protein